MRKGFGQRSAWEKHLRGQAVSTAPVTLRSQPVRRNQPARPSKNAYLAQLVSSANAVQQLDASVPDRQEFPMLAVPKPRMSVRDKFAPRACVRRYRAFGDELRLRGAKLPLNYRIEFHFPMPDSWPESIKVQMDGKPKMTRPDGSNLIKAVEDHLVPKDETLFKGTFEKYWSRKPRIVITKGEKGSQS